VVEIWWGWAEEAPLAVTPAAAQVSVRVGDSLEFAAVAPGEGTFAWLVWGRAVASGRTFTFVPGPEDAGWQQVTLVVTDVAGRELRRTWDVGVVPAVAPELVDVTPPAGVVERTEGHDLSLSVGARVPAARARDRVRFEWTIDEQPLHREEVPATAATSRVTILALPHGTHHVSVRVSEDDRVAAIADWTLEVAAKPAPPTVPPPATTPPSVTTPPAAATTPPPTTPPPTTPPPARAPTTTAPAVTARLVTLPGPRALEQPQGEPVVFAVRVDPAGAPVVFTWTVDGRRVPRAAAPRFDYDARTPGRHRIAVTAAVGGREIGNDAWTVDVLAPEPPPVAVTPPRPPPEPPPGGLAEEEVRRWLDDYARAWSRKDVAALRRMGQVRSAADAEKLEQYFRSVSDIQVDVRVRSVRIDGTRASVEFERIDTVTDPGGRKQELRLPPLRKQIERTPQGLRFAEHGGAG
jgi:hypothetical protein